MVNQVPKAHRVLEEMLVKMDNLVHKDLQGHQEMMEKEDHLV